MNTLWLKLEAPFAAFRWLQAGVYRATAPVMPPTAAWGLVLNLAHVETRSSGAGVVTLIDPGAPPVRVAVGVMRASERAVLYQQLHSYLIGTSGKEQSKRTQGAKYWIAPVRRELLINFECFLGIQAVDERLLERVRLGIEGALSEPRYGLPFAGDNNFLFDRIDVLDDPPVVHWYERLEPHDKPRPGSCRLTVGIDRADSSRTRSELFVPTEARTPNPPDGAWTWTPSPPSEGSETGRASHSR